jgi:hypothetical protein
MITDSIRSRLRLNHLVGTVSHPPTNIPRGDRCSSFGKALSTCGDICDPGIFNVAPPELAPDVLLFPPFSHR